MEQIMNFPGILSLCALLCLWAAARLGVFVRGRLRAVDLSELDEFGTVLGATLTLLGLLIGFTFSMAISRYDQRKNYEEEEANAIGTEYVRADLLPEPARTKVQAQLVQVSRSANPEIRRPCHRRRLRTCRQNGRQSERSCGTKQKVWQT